jgi:hypothetical protein
MSIWGKFTAPYWAIKGRLDERRERKNREKVLDVLCRWKPQLMTDNQIAARAEIELEEVILALDQMRQKLPFLVSAKLGVDITGNDAWKWSLTEDGVRYWEAKR